MNPYVIAAVLALFCTYTVGIYEFGVHNTRISIEVKANKSNVKVQKQLAPIASDVATHVGDNAAQLAGEKADVHTQIEAAINGCPAVAVVRLHDGPAVPEPAKAPGSRHAPAQAHEPVSEHAAGNQPSGSSETKQVTAEVINGNLDAGAENTVNCAGLQEWAARVCSIMHCE